MPSRVVMQTLRELEKKKSFFFIFLLKREGYVAALTTPTFPVGCYRDRPSRRLSDVINGSLASRYAGCSPVAVDYCRRQLPAVERNKRELNHEKEEEDAPEEYIYTAYR